MLPDLWNHLFSEEPESEEASDETLMKLVSFLAWGLLYLVVTVRTRRSAEWCCRLVTLLHGSLASTIGLWQCGVLSMSFKRLQEPCQPCHYALMLMSWGYFAFDLLWCLAYWTESALMLCHHVSALLFITRYMHVKMGGCVFGCALGGLEITNPLLQTRWFLREAKFDNTILFVVVEAAYFLLFLIVRGIIGTYIAIITLKSDEMNAETKAMGVVLYCVSLGFIYDIISFVLKKYPSRMAVVKESMATNFRRGSE